VDPKLFALGSALCFGLGPILVKMGYARNGHVDAAVMAGLGVGVPIYLILLPFVGGLHLDQLTPQAVVGFALGGLFGGGIGRRWMYIAIGRIGASPATAIKNAAPLFSTVLAILLFQEAVTLVHWLATVAIVAGIALVTWRQGKGFSLLDPGVLAAFASALSYAVRPIVVKFGLEDASLPVTASLIGMSAGLVYALVMMRPWRLTSADLPTRRTLRDPSLLPFIGSGIFQALGILCITTALSGGDVSQVYPITASAPLFTVAFTWLVLRGIEAVTWRTVAGTAAVVAGVILL
jgi:drug/metabolite transporter (DMT)-like permease